MGQRASRVQETPNQYQRFTPVPQEIIEIVYEDEDESLPGQEGCPNKTPENINLDPRLFHCMRDQPNPSCSLDVNISNTLPFGIQQNASRESISPPTAYHDDEDNRVALSPPNALGCRTHLSSTNKGHQNKRPENVKECCKLFQDGVRKSKDSNTFIPLNNTYSDEFDYHGLPIDVKWNKNQVLCENKANPSCCRRQLAGKEKSKVKYGQPNDRKQTCNHEKCKRTGHVVQKLRRTKDDLKKRYTVEKYNTPFDIDVDPTICDSLVPSFSDLGNLSDCSKLEDLGSLKEETPVNLKLMPPCRTKSLFHRDDRESSCSDHEDDNGITRARDADKENSSVKGYESDLDKAPTGFSDISDDKTINNWLTDPRLTELFESGFYSIDNESKRPLTFTSKMPPPHPNGTALTVFTLKPDDGEAGSKKGLKFGDVPQSSRPESRLIPDCLHFIDIVKRKTSQRRYTGKSSDSIFIGGNVTNTNPPSTSSHINIASDCQVSLERITKSIPGENNPQSLKLYSYRFWLPATPLVNQLFTNPADRRVESIGRLSDCRIRLTRWRRLNSKGFPQQMVVIIAPSAEALQKCCRIFDDKFPFFYATAGLLFCNKQQSNYPELKKTKHKFTDRCPQKASVNHRSCTSLQRRVISPSTIKVNTRHLNDWVRSNSGTVKGIGEADGYRLSHCW